MPRGPRTVPSMPPLVVVVHHDPGTADSLRHAVESASGWQVLAADPSPAGIAAALAAGPSVALVGCDASPTCPPTDTDRRHRRRRPPGRRQGRPRRGACSLLAWPDGAADLPGELARVAATGQPGSADGLAGLVVATRGVQGGAGATTVAVHLAAAWSRWGPAPVLLLDLAGGLAFRLDLGAAPTWSTLTPATGRQGRRPFQPRSWWTPVAWTLGMFAGHWPSRGPACPVLPLAGLADGAPDPPPGPGAVQEVLEVARSTFRVVVVDLPATDGPAVRTALSQADALVAVGRCETAGVRALQAALEAWAATGRDPDAAGAVVTGVRPRAPLAPREVRAASETASGVWSRRRRRARRRRRGRRPPPRPARPPRRPGHGDPGPPGGPVRGGLGMTTHPRSPGDRDRGQAPRWRTGAGVAGGPAGTGAMPGSPADGSIGGMPTGLGPLAPLLADPTWSPTSWSTAPPTSGWSVAAPSSGPPSASPRPPPWPPWSSGWSPRSGSGWTSRGPGSTPASRAASGSTQLPPLAPDGPVVTIRTFARRRLQLRDLIDRNASTPPRPGCWRPWSPPIAIAVSGATGTGKTTLLNVLAAAIPGRERVVTIEDLAELWLPGPMSSASRRDRPTSRAGARCRCANWSATPRMRPRPIVVGEVRGPEVLDMLQAANTGHRGLMTTLHAGSPEEVPAGWRPWPWRAGRGPRGRPPARRRRDRAVVHLERVPAGLQPLDPPAGAGRPSAGSPSSPSW